MNKEQNQQIDLGQILKTNYREIIFKYLAHWKLFIVLTVSALSLAYVYLRYTTPQYEASLTIMIKNNQKGGSGMSETSVFEDLTIFNEGLFIENEKSILQSRRLMTTVVDELNLRNEYHRIGNYTGLKKVEVYKNSPLSVEYKYLDTSHFSEIKSNTLFKIQDKFIEVENENGDILNKYEYNKFYPFDEKVSFRILKTSQFNQSHVGVTYRYWLLPLESCVDKYISRIKIELNSLNSTILKLKLTYNSSEKAVVILNKLIENYNEDAVKDKNLIAENTVKFISGRITVLAEELGYIEDSLKEIKTSSDLIDYQYESQNNLGYYKEMQSRSLEANTQLKLSQLMLDHITNNRAVEDFIPVNLGIEDNNIDIAIKEHNKMVIERMEDLKTSTSKNPNIVNLTYRINELKANIIISIRNVISAKQKIVNEVNVQVNKIDNNIGNIPKFEKDLRAIKRQQEIKERLYVYLLEKREEAFISLAVGVGNAKIVDPAYSNKSIVSPKPGMIYSISLLVSIVLGIIYIYISDLFKDKVYGKSDIDKFNLPYIGNIPLGEKDQQIVISKGSKTAISESFRSLRTNVDFMLSDKKDGRGKFIFITSTVAKEGKSFTAINFSLSLALSGKRVILLGMDLRAPKLEQYLGKDKSKGVTNFIVNSSARIEDYSYQSELHENLFIFPSGDIPPNPSELLMSDRIKELFDLLGAQYDYIIVDTAPVGIVTDTLLLSQYSDATIYVVRAHQLPRKMLNIAVDLHKDKRISIPATRF